MSNAKFDPNWTPIYDLLTRRMLFNDKAHAEQTVAIANQLEAITKIINAYEERIHELEARLKVVEQAQTVLENTSPSEKRGPGRPRKEQEDVTS